MKSPTSSRGRGFTLIEVLLVIALLAIVAGMSLLIGTDSIGRATAIAERDLVITFLQTARAEALANVDESAHGLHIAADTYVLFAGAAYDPADPDNRSYNREPAVTVTGPSDIIFDQLSGDVGTGAGTLTFTDSAAEATLSINGSGRIDW